MHWASLITFVTCHLRHLLQFYTMMLHPQNIFFILHRWRTGDPLSLSLVLPPALFWDFYPPSGTQCLTLLLPRRRRRWWVLVLFLMEVILSPPMASITSHPFLSTWLLSPECKRSSGCWQSNVAASAVSTQSAEGLQIRVFQYVFWQKTKKLYFTWWTWSYHMIQALLI